MSTSKVYLPMFPLNLLLLPGEQTELHLFEPRYLQLYDDVADGSDFVMPYIDNGSLGKIGSNMRVVETLKKHGNGKVDVAVECTGLVSLLSFDQKQKNKLYAGGNVLLRKEYVNWRASEDLLVEFEMLRRVFGERGKHLGNLEYSYVLNILAFLDVSNKDKYQFLMMNDQKTQQRTLTQMVRFARLVLGQEKEKEHGFYMN